MHKRNFTSILNSKKNVFQQEQKSEIIFMI
jgi:hypothetical protein